MIILRPLFLFFSWIISILPFKLLYLKSNFFYFILFYIIGYRKNVVFENIQQTFPDKNKNEIRLIAKKFYRNFIDIFLEVLKLKRISAEKLNERIIIKNPEILDNLYKQNTSILATLGHIGNWEWLGPLLASRNQFKVFGPAKPLSDPYFNKFINLNRSRFGFEPINYTQIYRNLVRHKNDCTASIMAADQSPVKSDQNYWATFLNKETPFYNGIEKIAKSLNLAVIYFDIQRSKRGFYEVELHLITDSPSKCSENEIINDYIRHLEESIYSHPDNWLWSHRRWKYNKPV